MSSACDKCAKPVKGDDEFVSCMAFCDRMIHLKCSSIKLNKAFVNVIHSSPNLFWMCDECVKLVKCARFKSAISSFGSVIKSITEKQEIANAEIKNEMAKQGELIAQLSKKIGPSTPAIMDPGNHSRQPPLKRRREDGLSSSRPLIGGTKAVTDSTVLTVPEPVEMFWLYLSRIHPSVKPDVIAKLVKTSVQSEDSVKVVPLVKRGFDTSRMNFISYKVGMDPKLREVALNSDSWPRGILFREFVDNGPKNSWLPRMDTPSIVISPLGSSQFTTPISGLDPAC